MILRKLNNLFKIQHFAVIQHHAIRSNLRLSSEFQNARCLHSSRIKSKLYFDKENLYAHDVLAKHQVYNTFEAPSVSELPHPQSIDSILQNNAAKTPNQIFEEFKQIAKYCGDNNVCISNDKFDEFIDVFTERCHGFTDHQLTESFKYLILLPRTPNIYHKNFMELWLAFDDALCDRLEGWKIDEVLRVCESWYMLHLAKKCKFVWQALRRVGRRIKKMGKSQMVHSLFFCNLVRKPLLDMFDYEVAWKKYFNEMSIEEIGVMSMGFFKTETPVRDPQLIEMIYRRLMEQLNNIEDITLVNILKILRYSSKIPQADIMYELLDKLCDRVDKISLLACLHIGLLGCDMQHCHEKCIELIVKRFANEVDKTRLKDLERMTHVMSLFNIANIGGTKEELCVKVLAELRNRIPEIIAHPKCFPACLHYLTLCGYHDEELISTALDQRFMRHAYGKNLMLGREIFCLDSFTRINLAEKYSGNQLTEKNRATMGKLLTHYIPERNTRFKLNVTDRISLEVMESLQRIFKIVSIKHILPHFQRPDIILCYDKVQKKAVKLGKICEENYKGVILNKQNMLDDNVEVSDIETLAIVVYGWNSYVRGTERLTGIAEIKLKQLEILNHKYIVVPWHEWRELEGEGDRQQYLKRKLASIVEL